MTSLSIEANTTSSFFLSFYQLESSSCCDFKNHFVDLSSRTTRPCSQLTWHNGQFIKICSAVWSSTTYWHIAVSTKFHFCILDRKCQRGWKTVGTKGCPDLRRRWDSDVDFSDGSCHEVGNLVLWVLWFSDTLGFVVRNIDVLVWVLRLQVSRTPWMNKPDAVVLYATFVLRHPSRFRKDGWRVEYIAQMTRRFVS